MYITKFILNDKRCTTTKDQQQNKYTPSLKILSEHKHLHDPENFLEEHE